MYITSLFKSLCVLKIPSYFVHNSAEKYIDILCIIQAEKYIATFIDEYDSAENFVILYCISSFFSNILFIIHFCLKILSYILNSKALFLRLCYEMISYFNSHFSLNGLSTLHSAKKNENFDFIIFCLIVLYYR